MHVFKDTPSSARAAEWDALLQALNSLERGDTTVRLAPGRAGVRAEVHEAFNRLAETHAAMAAQVKQLKRGNGKRKNGRSEELLLAPPFEARHALNGEAGEILSALSALKNGDGSATLPVAWPGVSGRIAETFNDVVALLYGDRKSVV